MQKPEDLEAASARERTFLVENWSVQKQAFEASTLLAYSNKNRVTSVAEASQARENDRKWDGVGGG